MALILILWLDFGVYDGRENFRYYKNAIMRLCMDGSAQGFERLQILNDAITLWGPEGQEA